MNSIKWIGKVVVLEVFVECVVSSESSVVCVVFSVLCVVCDVSLESSVVCVVSSELSVVCVVSSESSVVHVVFSVVGFVCAVVQSVVSFESSLVCELSVVEDDGSVVQSSGLSEG